MVSSSGVLFVYIAAQRINENEIAIQHLNSYQYLLDFYDRVKALQELVRDEADVEFLAVVGAPEKVEVFMTVIREQILGEFESILNGWEVELDRDDLDFLGNDFLWLVREQVFEEDRIKFPREQLIEAEYFDVGCFWAGQSPEDEGYRLINSAVATWMKYEKPVICGKQLMIQSFQFRDLEGRKIIGVYPEKESEQWFLILEGGLKLYLNSGRPYMRERIGMRDLPIFTISGLDTVLNNPIYGYGTFYGPPEVYEEWHKVFLYAAAVSDVVWSVGNIVPIYEKFLGFLETNICEVMSVEPIIDKEMFWSVLLKNIMMVRGFLQGEEEAVISKDLLTLLNSRYVYLPYISEIFDYVGTVQDRPEPTADFWGFDVERLQSLIRLSESGTAYQKGRQWEAAVEYFVSQIKGLKITGRRVKAATQEIDLSAANVSLDAALWEMGAYILIECKNWSQKVGIEVIRGLSYISSIKGNKTTLLFTVNGVTREAKAEILRAALNRNFILCFTKEEMLEVKTKQQCYTLLFEKWRELQELIDREMMV